MKCFLRFFTILVLGFIALTMMAPLKDENSQIDCLTSSLQLQHVEERKSALFRIHLRHHSYGNNQHSSVVQPKVKSLINYTASMGCGVSTPVEQSETTQITKDKDRRISVMPEKPPEIKITGKDVQFVQSPNCKVIFIFGGPGSGKGRIVANLRSMFGMKLISSEALIFKYLPKKVQHAMTLDDTRAMAQLVRKDPSHVQLEWLLRLLQHSIESDLDQIFLVDLVPNLNWLIRNEYLIKECSEEMAAFENKIPISFAINLCVKESSLGQTLDYSHHNANVPAGASVCDEADNSKAVRRYKMHINAVQPFLKYFTDTNRLVTIDASSGAAEPIWDSVHEFFTSLHLTAWRPVNSVLVFALGGLSVGRLDLTDCDMQTVTLKDVVPDPQAPLDGLLDALGHYIDTQADTTCHYFVVDPMGTTLKTASLETVTKKRGIIFSDIKETNEGCVNKYSRLLNSLTELPKPYFKAVCSSEDETLIFPADTDDGFCQQVALYMAEKHPSKR